MKKRIGILLLALIFLPAAGCGTENQAAQALSEEFSEEAKEAEESLTEEDPSSVEEAAADPVSDMPEETSAEETETALLPGAALNGSQYATGNEPLRVTYADGFYYEPVSEALKDYITGTSYPETDDEDSLAISCDDLRYVHVLYCDFNGESAEGELICNASIAQDLTEIFCELYENNYQVEQIRLVDEYDGDDDASMAADNTSCFNYRTVSGSGSLSNHALGRAVDINPLYNPCITYNSDGTADIAPEAGAAYADRTASFAHKIDSDDLCCRLFLEHGFTWGGSWNSLKDYQHFEK